MAQQDPQVNRITIDLDGMLVNSVTSARDQLGTHLPEAHRSTTAPLATGAYHSSPAEQNIPQNPPNKRPRLEKQTHSAIFTANERQPASLYYFISLPLHSPSVDTIAMPPPPPTATASPRVAAGSHNTTRGHAAVQAPMSRRQSSLSNMGISQQQPMHPSQTMPTTTTVTPSMSPHPTLQPVIASPSPNAMLHLRLQSAYADPVVGQIFKEEWGLKRGLLLGEACKSADWFYLTLHQIYCWRTITPAVMGRLGIVGVREVALFRFTQQQLIGQVARISEGLPEAPPDIEASVAKFATEYFDRRRDCVHRPALTGNASNAEIAVQHLAAHATPASSTSPPSTSTPATLSQYLIPGLPPTRALQKTASTTVLGVHSGVTRKVSKRTTSTSQLAVAANIPQTTLGPRQQNFMQETPGAQATGNFPVRRPSERLPVPHSTSLPEDLRSAQNFSTRSRHQGLTPTINGVSATQQIGYSSQDSTSLLPSSGAPITQNTNPNPDLIALHQARLSTPEPSIPRVGGRDTLRLFQVFQRFVLTPQLITKKQSYYSWQIDISEVDIFRTALNVSVAGHKGRPATKLRREFRRGTFVYRLRCISPTSGLQEADWTIAPTFWPASCFVSLGEKEIELRRKSHWGRNLPCDLTHGVKPGPNVIEMSVHFSPEEMADTYAVAVELLEVFDHSQCSHKLRLIQEPDSLHAIVASLKTATSDENVAIVDPHISIDLIDPFNAQPYKEPVCGNTCTHRECFDLKAFLESRPNKHTGAPLSSAGNWKCSICNKDARPQSLVLDGFLLSVSKQIRAGSDEGEEVRAIRVTADGSWQSLKAEKQDVRSETSITEDLGNATSARSTPSLNASKESVLRAVRQGSVIVIELDDD